LNAKFIIKYEVEQTADPMQFEMEGSALGFSATDEELLRMYDSYVLAHFKEKLKLKGKNRDEFLTWARNEIRSHQPSITAMLRRNLSRYDLVRSDEIRTIANIFSSLEFIKGMRFSAEKLDDSFVVVAEIGSVSFCFKLLNSDFFYENMYEVSVIGTKEIPVFNEKAENDDWQVLHRSVIVFVGEISKIRKVS